MHAEAEGLIELTIDGSSSESGDSLDEQNDKESSGQSHDFDGEYGMSEEVND